MLKWKDVAWGCKSLVEHWESMFQTLKFICGVTVTVTVEVTVEDREKEKQTMKN